MIPLYKNSNSYALRFGDIDACRESFNENIRCKKFLDEQVAKNFDGFHLTGNFLEESVKEFGYDRTMWVIGSTILERKGDGRFRKENVEWAKRLGILPDRHNYEFALNSHSCIVDDLAKDIRKMYAKLGLFTSEHIIKSDEPQDFTDKLLILRDTSLVEEKRTPENQLFLASSGFGCSPGKTGRKVFGEFLSDGEKTHFYRQDFIGVIADEYIPDWAREKLEKIIAQQEQMQDDSPKMGM
ncbi:MAG: DUF3849 domain-containing protein [Oscillospiraceae bacterium]|nr:DUF3849 domain-containing protein [Oscillospiraceae bacterium]